VKSFSKTRVHHSSLNPWVLTQLTILTTNLRLYVLSLWTISVSSLNLVHHLAQGGPGHIWSLALITFIIAQYDRYKIIPFLDTQDLNFQQQQQLFTSPTFSNHQLHLRSIQSVLYMALCHHFLLLSTNIQNPKCVCELSLHHSNSFSWLHTQYYTTTSSS